MRLILILPLLFSTAACSDEKPQHRAVIEWTPMPATEVQRLCGNAYRDGCVKRIDGICYIVTEMPPLQEFTGYNSDMHSRTWNALAHEVMHCFGYEHR